MERGKLIKLIKIITVFLTIIPFDGAIKYEEFAFAADSVEQCELDSLIDKWADQQCH